MAELALERAQAGVDGALSGRRRFQHRHRLGGLAQMMRQQVGVHRAALPAFLDLVSGDQLVEALVLAVQLDQLAQRQRVVGIALERGLVARDHARIERGALDLPVVLRARHHRHGQAREEQHGEQAPHAPSVL